MSHPTRLPGDDGRPPTYSPRRQVPAPRQPRRARGTYLQAPVVSPGEWLTLATVRRMLDAQTLERARQECASYWADEPPTDEWFGLEAAS